jgi:Mg2+-importing ATPase
MLTFGSLSSLFDFVIFAILLQVLHAGAAEFQTGWFIESLATQILVVFVIRTHASPFWRSRPSPALIAAAVAGVAAAILLPYTLRAAPLGFTPLPASYLPIVATLVVVYLALVEVTKRALFTPADLLRPRPYRQHPRFDGCTAAPPGSPPEPDRRPPRTGSRRSRSTRRRGSAHASAAAFRARHAP